MVLMVNHTANNAHNTPNVPPNAVANPVIKLVIMVCFPLKYFLNFECGKFTKKYLFTNKKIA